MIGIVVNDEEHTKECLSRLHEKQFCTCSWETNVPRAFCLVPEKHHDFCDEEWDQNGRCVCGGVIGWVDRYTSSDHNILPEKKMLRDVRNFRRNEGFEDSAYIVVQALSRHYGGPEEGGWWYDWYENVKVVELNPSFAPGYPFWRLLLNAVRSLREQYVQPRYNRFSAANSGEPEYRFLIVHHEKAIPAEDRERPHYE